MQTSAHPTPEADLFGAIAPPRLTFSGTLAQNAEVRVKPVGADATPMPVLRLVLQHDGPGQQTVVAEQVYTAATRHLAEQAAAVYRIGRRVTVTTPMHHLRLLLPHVESIALAPEEALQ